MSTIDCREAVALLWDYLDGELTEPKMEAVRSHIAVCARCWPHFDFERAFLDAVASTREERGASEGLKHRVQAALAAEGYGR